MTMRRGRDSLAARPAGEPELERLVMAQQAEDEAKQSGRNCDAAAEEVQMAQAAVNRIRNDIWWPAWGWLLKAVRQ